MPGRKYTNGSEYRYGFNGKEKDKDMNNLTTYDYGFRIYNPAIGKFLSVDPLFKGFPWNSPYSYAEGDVMRCVDLDGLEKAVSIDEGTIEIQMIVVAFTNRPSKVINGKTYSGGNLPLGFNPDLAKKVYEKAYQEVNAGLNGKEFPLKLIEKEDPELAKTLYKGVAAGGPEDKKYKLRYNAKLLVFTDEDEMNNSDEIKAAMKNDIFSGLQLYGSESYAVIGAGEVEAIPIILTSDDGLGQSFGKGTTPNKAKLIRTFDENPSPTNSGTRNAMSRSTIVHEDAHQLGVSGHIGDGDPIVNPVTFSDGQTYNGIGMMKYAGASRKAEAPFLSQVVQILSWIRFEKPKPKSKPVHTDDIHSDIDH